MYIIHKIEKASKYVILLDAITTIYVLPYHKPTIFQKHVLCFVKMFTSYKSSKYLY